jgi:predicted RNA-binding Zn-ribbon protein involved in translation (DUF1610 family)
MIRTVVECQSCYNRTIIGHNEEEIILFCPHCGEEQDQDLEPLDFSE